MPQSYPMTTAEFIDALPISSIKLDCPEVSQVSITRGAEALVDAIGERYWVGEVHLGKMMRQEKRAVQALLDLAQSAGASFMMHDVAQEFPLLDRDGSELGSATPKIAALPTDTRLLALWDLPPGYVLSRGDCLAFSYRSSPTRYAFHRIVDATVAANGTGATQQFEVIPHIRPGAALDTDVALIRPAFKAIILPETLDPGRTSGFITEGMGFRFMQTLR